MENKTMEKRECEKKSCYKIKKKKWKKLRRKKLNDKPVCEKCWYAGRFKRSEYVHHVISPFARAFERDMNMLMYNYNNLVALCRKCHNRKIKELENKKYNNDEIIENIYIYSLPK